MALANDNCIRVKISSDGTFPLDYHFTSPTNSRFGAIVCPAQGINIENIRHDGWVKSPRPEVEWIQYSAEVNASEVWYLASLYGVHFIEHESQCKGRQKKPVEP